MSTPRDNTNTTERSPRPSGGPQDEPQRASGPERQSTMPPRRSWLWFALILLANFLIVRLLFPGPEAAVEVPYTFFKEQVTYPPKGEEGSQPGSTKEGSEDFAKRAWVA
jgi:hypothetical protein